MNTNPNTQHLDERLAKLAVGLLAKSTTLMYAGWKEDYPSTSWTELNESLALWEMSDSCTTDYLQEYEPFQWMHRDRVEMYALAAMDMVAQMSLARAVEIANAS